MRFQEANDSVQRDEWEIMIEGDDRYSAISLHNVELIDRSAHLRIEGMSFLLASQVK